MKVFTVILLALGTVSAAGSGPYLPSGWRPQGPAFLLPSEAEKPADNPLKETLFQESEASGSDFLREYGPPKVEDITKQDLPDVVTVQSFLGEAKSSQEEDLKNAGVVEATTEVILEETTAADEVTSTESSLVEDSTTEAQPVIQGKSLDIVLDINDSEVSTTESVAISQEENENANSNLVAAVEEKVGDAVVEEVRTVAEESVKNIAEALTELDNEIRTQVQSVQEVSEVKTVVESSGSLEQAPEGFLEYGPPGFREYGPPKDDALKAAEEYNADTIEAVESNETRRRRFSPKFRSARKVL